MLQVAPYSVYRALHDKYIGKILGVVAEGMRTPSIQEVRRFDRAMHEELLRWLSRDLGTLENGLRYYIENEGLPLWKLLDPVISTLPDQGVEKSASAKETDSKKRKQPDVVPRPRSPRARSPRERSPIPRRPKAPVNLPKKTCLVCKKKHFPLCELPADFRKKQREELKAKKRAVAVAKPKSAPRADGE